MTIECKKIHYVKIEKENNDFVIIEGDSSASLRKQLADYFYNNISAFWYHWNRRIQKVVLAYKNN